MAVKKGSIGVGHVPRKSSYCLLLLQTTATIRDNCHYSNDLLQGGLEDCLLHFLYMAVLLAEICAMITNSTLIQGNFWYITSL